MTEEATVMDTEAQEDRHDLVERDRRYVFHTWSAQAHVDPVPIAGAKGAHIWDHDGNRYLDFASQFVYMNIGHQHPAVIAGVIEQAERLCVIAPYHANETRVRAASLICDRAPMQNPRVLFTNGGADAVEHAVRLARLHTGRHKVLSAYRSYHGATAMSISLTGDPRRWPSEPAALGVVHFFGPYFYRSPFASTDPEEESERALAHLRAVLESEDPSNVAAVVLEAIPGPGGVLVPPPGYLAGVRSLCDEFGVVMVADEVMTGFGRVGEWFAINHWDVVPDLITFAKGVTSGYVPLGGVIMSDAVASTFDERIYPGGLTYSGHPLACAAAVAVIQTMEREHVLEHVRELGERIIGPALGGLFERHGCIGEVRGQGVFWALELVKDRETREPVVPYGPLGPTEAVMQRVVDACRESGLWPYVTANRIYVAPPCTITEEEVREGISILDEALRLVESPERGMRGSP
jgi:taurine--2-oxoglutarate transaminase